VKTVIPINKLFFVWVAVFEEDVRGGGDVLHRGLDASVGLQWTESAL